MPKLKKVDLTDLLSQVEDFRGMIGDGEFRTLMNAATLIGGTFPYTDEARRAYLTSSGEVQAELINLQSRVNYVLHLKKVERNAYWGELVENEKFTGRTTEREHEALNRDSQFRDMEETLGTLKVVADMVEAFLWSVKVMTQRL